MMNKNIIGQRIAERLKDCGWSEKQLSDRAGLGHGYVSAGLSKEDWKPHAGKLAQLASALDVDTAWLEGKTDVMRAAGRIVAGAAWVGKQGDLQAAPILDAIDKQISGLGGTVTPYTLAADVTGFGIPPGGTVLVSTNTTYAAGDLLLTQGHDGRHSIKYLVEPYLIGQLPDGRLTHEYRQESTDILGRVILVVTVPDL